MGLGMPCPWSGCENTTSQTVLPSLSPTKSWKVTLPNQKTSAKQIWVHSRVLQKKSFSRTWDYPKKSQWNPKYHPAPDWNLLEWTTWSKLPRGQNLRRQDAIWSKFAQRVDINLGISGILGLSHRLISWSNQKSLKWLRPILDQFWWFTACSTGGIRFSTVTVGSLGSPNSKMRWRQSNSSLQRWNSEFTQGFHQRPDMMGC